MPCSVIACRLFRYILLFQLGPAVEAGLRIAPSDIITRPGEDVRLNCSTESLDSVDWMYRKDKNQLYRSIFIGRTGGGGDKSNGYLISKRIHVDVDIRSGQYDLIIESVTQADEGEYVCYDISDQDSPASAKLLLEITGEAKTESCSYDVAASVGSEVQLNFSTTQSHTIHLEHRSIDRSYPLHVFRDGRIVNDYYVLSGRFDVKISAGVWTLVIKDVQMTDAGTFIFSEDNGLGKQDIRELIVLDWEKVEMFTAKNCTVRFAGNCPPLLEWRQSTDGENGTIRRLKSVTSRDEAVITVTRDEDGDGAQRSVSCVAMTTFTVEHINQRSYLVIQELSSCDDKATSFAFIIAIIVSTIFAILAIFFFWFIKRRGFIRQLLLKSSDVVTPIRQSLSKPASPIDVVIIQDKLVTQGLLMKVETPVCNAGSSGTGESSTRRRNQNGANKENIMNADSVNNSNKKYCKNANAKRRLSLDRSSLNCQNIADDLP